MFIPRFLTHSNDAEADEADEAADEDAADDDDAYNYSIKNKQKQKQKQPLQLTNSLTRVYRARTKRASI